MARDVGAERSKGQGDRRGGTQRSSRGAVAVGAASVLVAVFATLAATSAAAVECTGDPLFVTEDCTDPRFNNPQIDLVEQRNDPLPHTYVHGFFPDTDARFSFYFPPADQYEGRFHLQTHQLQGDENFVGGNAGGTLESNLTFSFASGAYYVRTNLGGIENPLVPLPIGAADTSIRGYRVNTEAARFSREVANDIYADSHGEHRPYGYIYGGSGGSYMTICTAQQTSGIWDGAVPYISANHMATPYTYTVRILALRLIRDTGINLFPQVMDAIDPGGSGDPLAGLSPEQAQAFEEATRFGFPPRGWWDFADMTAGALPLVASEVPITDPTYPDDFWNQPGYAGFDDPFGTLAAVRVQDPPQARTVLANLGFGLLLDSAPPASQATGADLIVDTGAAAGATWSLVAVPGGNIVVPFTSFSPFGLSDVNPGDKVHIDNSLVIALQYYNRHQDPQFDKPAGEPNYSAWDQWRDESGDPLFVQRDITVGLARATSSAGCVENGQFQGKMSVVNNLMDIDATPWYADWYRRLVESRLGDQTDKHYRLYFNDHAQHGNPSSPAAHARTVNYRGMLQQTVRDMAKWVEQGKRPPASTRYVLDEDTQIQVPHVAAVRKGLQPVVHLWANGKERADIAVGDTVTFHAIVAVPPRAGRVVKAEWDFLGVGDYPDEQEIRRPRRWALFRATHTYTEPGTYFPVLRAASQRQGDPDDELTHVNNLARVRVVVE